MAAVCQPFINDIIFTLLRRNVSSVDIYMQYSLDRTSKFYRPSLCHAVDEVWGRFTNFPSPGVVTQPSVLTRSYNSNSNRNDRIYVA